MSKPKKNSLAFWRETGTHLDKTGPKEFAWFVSLWVLGVFTITIIGLIIKLVLKTN